MKNVVILLVIFSASVISFGGEEDFVCPQGLVTNELRQFVYQFDYLNQLTRWDNRSRVHRMTKRGEVFLQKANAFLKDGYDEPIDLEDIRKNKLIFQCRALAGCCQLKSEEDTFKKIVCYASKNNFTESSLLPEEFFPSLDELDFIPFFNKYICNRYFLRPKCGNNPCDISDQDREVIERILSGPSEDKAILFVGFDQIISTEGSEILADTAGYRRSMFLSNWNDRPESNHNILKFCFCKIENLLADDPVLNGFFDYIIIGGQTTEYVPTQAWIAFSKMIKKGGRIVYPKHPDLFCFSQFVNQLLMSSSGKSFNLYQCSDMTESVYQEICQYTAFNNEHTFGDFCYRNPNRPLVWHKCL